MLRSRVATHHEECLTRREINRVLRGFYFNSTSSMWPLHPTTFLSSRSNMELQFLTIYHTNAWPSRRSAVFPGGI